jgi:hypothetical protein
MGFRTGIVKGWEKQPTLNLMRVRLGRLGKKYLPDKRPYRSKKLFCRRKLHGAASLKARLKRIEAGCEFGRGARSGARHWARLLQAFAYAVKLVAPRFFSNQTSRAKCTTSKMLKLFLKRRVGQHWLCSGQNSRAAKYLRCASIRAELDS